MFNTERKGKRVVFLIVWLSLIAALVTAIFVIGLSKGESESIREVMRDGVLHDKNKVSFLGLAVNPAVISAYAVTAILLFAALLIRIFAIPRFKTVPGKFQAVLEKAVDFFYDMAKGNCSRRVFFAGAYIFSAGIYIFFGTLFELFGAQAVSTSGGSITLPAPLADINGALAMGVLSFLVILGAGLFTNGPKGALRVLKDFSLPISMSFRLFGALLSGLLVTELVYYYTALNFVVPVLVGVIFTLLHAVIQSYVLTILVSIFYGEAVEHLKKRDKKQIKTNKNSESEVIKNEE
ncbi:MAG: F0F1 ATP synthase subunit A [Clostridia bacterium]|nr:F0F1 ATP synthase subunit A [Clostridia bacterium]